MYKLMENKQLIVRQRILSPKQNIIKASNAKRIVINAGRRFGKTILTAHIGAERMLNGERVLYVAPSLDQTEAFFTEVLRIFADLIDAGLVYKNATKKLVSCGRGTIRAKTANLPENLRGDSAGLLILDEFAEMNPEMWELVGIPMLLDTGGNAIFISTPKRRNHFFRLFMRCEAGTRWESFHATSHENPHLNQEALDDLTKDMTAEAYRQEIMAEFLDSQGMVFSNLDNVLTLGEGNHNKHSGHKVVAGIDLAKSDDFTVMTIGCADCKEELHIFRINNISYIEQRKQIVALADRWKIKAILAESNAMGEPIIEELAMSGLPITGFATTASSKPPLIEALQLACETEEWHFLKNEIVRKEMMAYEVKYNKNGKPSYSGVKGVHDDMVISKALMIRAGNQSRPQFTAVDIDW